MAKTKQDYINLGKADALAGKPRMALAAGNWQAGAYDSGYDAAESLLKVESVSAACLAAEAGPAMQTVKAINCDTNEVVNLRLPKKTVEAISRLAPPNSMFHAFTDTPPQIVMQHVNRLSAERAVETDARRRSRLLKSVNRIVDRWNKKATLRRMAEVRAYDKGRAV